MSFEEILYDFSVKLLRENFDCPYEMSLSEHTFHRLIWELPRQFFNEDDMPAIDTIETVTLNTPAGAILIRKEKQK